MRLAELGAGYQHRRVLSMELRHGCVTHWNHWSGQVDLGCTHYSSLGPSVAGHSPVRPAIELGGNL
jgi:hypothetical protein